MQNFMQIYVQLLRMLIVNYTQEQRRYIYHPWKKVISLLKTAWFFAIKNRRDRYLIHFIHIQPEGKPGTLSRGKGRPRASFGSDMISDHCKWRKTDTSLNLRRDFKQVCFCVCVYAWTMRVLRSREGPSIYSYCQLLPSPSPFANLMNYFLSLYFLWQETVCGGCTYLTKLT